MDCHFHLDENMISLGDLIGAMDQGGIQKAALIAKLCEPFYISHTRQNEVMKKLMRSLIVNLNPIGKAIYSSFVDGRGNFKILGNTVGITTIPDNDSVARAVEKFPDRFLGWVTVNPKAQRNALEEIEAYLGRPGVVGVKAHPFFHEYHIELLDEVAGFCQERNYPLLVHLSAQWECYRRLPDKFPRLRIIYAHAGVPHFKKLWDYLREQKNIYIDLSSDYLDQSTAGLAVRAAGYERCLYGTDGPYGIERPGGTYDYSKMKGWIERFNIPDRQKDHILGLNFIELIQ